MYNSISIYELAQKIKSEKVNLLDVREVAEFQSGHIASAKNIPLSAFDNAFSQLDKKKDYYIICHSGARSANACMFLSRYGYHVTNVMSGMCAWKGAII